MPPVDDGTRTAPVVTATQRVVRGDCARVSGAEYRSVRHGGVVVRVGPGAGGTGSAAGAEAVTDRDRWIGAE